MHFGKNLIKQNLQSTTKLLRLFTFWTHHPDLEVPGQRATPGSFLGPHTPGGGVQGANLAKNLCPNI